MNHKNILFLKIGALGDTVFALPAIHSIKSAFPNVHLAWLIGNRMAPLIENQPELDDIITADEQAIFSSNKLLQMKEIMNVRKKLKKTYDLILVAHRALSLLTLVQFKGPIYQIHRGDRKLPFHNYSVVVPPLTVHELLAIKKLVHEGLSYLYPNAKLNGLKWDADFSHIIAKSKIQLPSNYVIIHTGGGRNTKTEFQNKMWPHTTELVYRILEQTPLNVVILGLSGEDQNVIVDKNLSKRFYDLTGETSVYDLFKVIEQSNAFIGPDSGPLHIADSLNKKCLGIYGPTSDCSWGLLGAQSRTIKRNLSCSPCYKDDGYFKLCPYNHECMQELTAEMVFSAFMELFRLNG